MAAPAVGQSRGNGVIPSLTEDELKQTREYEKILRLRDDIFGGRHPRLKVPTHLLGKKGPKVNVALPRQSPRPAAVEPKPVASIITSSFTPPAASAPAKPPAVPLITTVATPSGIDPILLTKSDDLVKAEINLLRQRIERHLKDQGEGRKVGLPSGDTAPDLDVAHVLAQAQEIVKPDTAPEVHDRDLAVESAGASAVASDSVDENSFYSSLQNDSSVAEADEHLDRATEHAQVMQRQHVHSPTSPNDAALRMARRPAPRKEPGRGADSLSSPDDDLYVHLDTVPPVLGRGDESVPYVPARRASRDNLGQSEPEASRARETRPSVRVARPNPADHAGQIPRPFAQPNPVESPRRRTPPVADLSPAIPVFQNHIRSPLAPQPARVSPLAVAHTPAAPQPDHAMYHDDSQPSPEALRQEHRPRKRRRAEGDNGERRRPPSPRHISLSPEPYIKPEPVSPQPMYLTEIRPARQRPAPHVPLSPELSSAREVGSRSAMTLRRDLEGMVHRYDDRYELDSPSATAPILRTTRATLQRPIVYEQDGPRYRSTRYARPAHSPTSPLGSYVAAEAYPPVAAYPMAYRPSAGAGPIRHLRPEPSPSPRRPHRSPPLEYTSFRAPSRVESTRHIWVEPETVARRPPYLLSRRASDMNPYYEPARISLAGPSRTVEEPYGEPRSMRRASVKPVMVPSERVASVAAYSVPDYPARSGEISRAHNAFLEPAEVASRRRFVAQVDDEVAPRSTTVRRLPSGRADSVVYTLPPEYRTERERESVHPEPMLARTYAGSFRREMGAPAPREYSVRPGATVLREYNGLPGDGYAYVPETRVRRYADDGVYAESTRMAVENGHEYHEEARRASYRL
ncbi:MAG: hypothetical protein M1838_001260 [Thelocarpon superellum]|nr:MAG: hypothetical protein M1838_001260 [Thelocarpon superellum]